MKKKLFSIAIILIILYCCKQKKVDVNTTTNDAARKMGETGIENAGKAKRPNGKLSCTIDGTTITADDNTVQCMFIGTGQPNYAQGMITGNATNIQVSGIMMTKPELATIKGLKIGDPAGLMIIKDGVQYNSVSGGNTIITITKIKQDGNNHYIGGTFSGTLKAADGKTITVTNGTYESAYL